MRKKERIKRGGGTLIHARCCRTVCTVEPPIKDTPYQRHNIISFLATNDVAFQEREMGEMRKKERIKREIEREGGGGGGGE